MRINTIAIVCIALACGSCDSDLGFVPPIPDTFVIQAGPEFAVLGRNSLDEMTLATPAVANGSIILRTASKLYRIGTRDVTP